MTWTQDTTAERMIGEADSAIGAGVMRTGLHPYKIVLMRNQST